MRQGLQKVSAENKLTITKEDHEQVKRERDGIQRAYIRSQEKIRELEEEAVILREQSQRNRPAV